MRVFMGVQASTRATYSAGQRSFLGFCRLYDQPSVPASEDLLLWFAAYLADAIGLRHGTVKNYMYAVRSLHIDLGYRDPLSSTIRLSKALRAIELSQGGTIRRKLAITYQILQRFRALHDPHHLKQSVLWAACTLAHFALLRCGEFTLRHRCSFDPTRNLCVQDITPYFAKGTLSYITVFLRSSKTDPFRHGVSIVVGCSGTDICGACAAWGLLQFHHKIGTPPNAPFFQLAGRALHRKEFISHVRECLLSIGIPPAEYAGHSFRIGGATTAAAAGFSDWEIKLLGRWKSETYQRYIRDDPIMCSRFASRMTAPPAASPFTFFRPYPKPA